MSDYVELLKKAGEFHGDTCGGIVMGTKLAIHGMESLGMTPGEKDKRLIVFTDIDRCICDAIQSVTKTSLGKKSLKPMGYGKFAATFVNIDTGEAVRVLDIDANNKDTDIEAEEEHEETIEELTERIAKTPGEELFLVQEVSVKIDPNDLPGKPLEIAKCVECDEVVMDGKQHLKGGLAYCTSCFEKSYYQLL
ncbi:MAG: formylmethanofuran dehydrogenase [Methanobacterium sp.]|nr:formylmethanofuran dehydrogenase [Methanobacterium sp.]